MFNHLLKIIVVFFAFFFVYLHSSSLVFAQTASLGIYPPLLETMIQPGKTITQVYRVINNGQVDLTLISRLVPFNPSDTQGGVILQDSNDFPGRDYFSFQNANLELGQKFNLKAGQEQQVVLKIKIPPHAPEGDYYRTLLFQTLPDPDLRLNGAQTQLQIGGHLLLTVSSTGTPQLNSEVAEFIISNSSFVIRNLYFIDSFTKPQIILKIRNTGTAFFKPQGTITAKGLWSSKQELELLPENILSGYSRQIRCAQPQNTQENLIMVPQDCQLGSGFLFGPYQLRLGYGLTTNSADNTARFVLIALPFKLFFVIFVLAILFALIKSRLNQKNVINNT